MAWFSESQDHLPLTWWKGHPVYLAAVLALAGLASMVLTAIFSPWMAVLVFSFDNLVDRYFVWTLLTYVLVNVPSLWLVLGCFMLWRFGEAVERHLGRRAFVKLVVLLMAALPLMTLLLGTVGMHGFLSGITYLEFGVFLAFATLYPRAQLSLILITVEVWMLAAVFVAVYALAAIASRDWFSLAMLATDLAVAFGYIRYEQGQLKMPSLSSLMPRRAMRKAEPVSTTPRERPQRTRRNEAPVPDVDDILDKISREGMHSLTPEERVVLERASKDLQKRKR